MQIKRRVIWVGILAWLVIAILGFFVGLPPVFVLAGAPEVSSSTKAAALELANLEIEFGGRLGVYAINTADGIEISYRADERFPLCSTFKAILAAAVLDKSTGNAMLLEERIYYSKNDLVTYSPISEKHLDSGMTVAEMCAAAVQYSDNTAANQLMKVLGGPEAVTEFARKIGNQEFRLDRWETELNSAIPEDPRDTDTPESMGKSLLGLTLGTTLTEPQKQQLNAWLLGNTTGAKRIKAALPADWKIGDKTGSGDYGTANDVAVLWPPGREPIILAIYTTQKTQDAKWRDEIVAEAARIVMGTYYNGSSVK